MSKKINGTDEIWGDSVHIVLYGHEINGNNDSEADNEKGVVITKYICREYGDSMTFDKALEIAKENGFTKGTFLMIVENPLRGTIYQYANCYNREPFWFEYGTTQGYA